jgi:hypothetical protein
MLQAQLFESEESVERSKRGRTSVDDVRSGRPSTITSVKVKEQIYQSWKEAMQERLKAQPKPFYPDRIRKPV